MRGLYVHVPFCVSKCSYCDFYSVEYREDLAEKYIGAVLIEARAYAGLSFDTLYLGGGTPGVLGPAALLRLVEGLQDIFDLSNLVEGTIEVNPESASEELLSSALDLGLDRLSVGVQSLSDGELRSVGRVHSAGQAVAAVSRAMDMGFDNVSADVMVGLPGQTLDSLRLTLQTLIGLGMGHLSVYCLSLEPGTPLTVSPPHDLPSDDLQAELFVEARSLLERHGLLHYEISNFSLPGRECRHNLNYWRGGEYLGLGPAAASHIGGRRWKNGADLPAYVRDPCRTVEEVEQLGPEEKAAEEAMLRLRLLQEGLAAEELSARFGPENAGALLSRLDRLVTQGLLVRNGDPRYLLPRDRVLTSNPIFAGLLAV